MYSVVFVNPRRAFRLYLKAPHKDFKSKDPELIRSSIRTGSVVVAIVRLE